jgi:radical SAM protein with 4Fe4S-binding SPASM domain
MSYIQQSPFCIQMEAVEGCNLRCAFCGIRGIRESGDRANLSGPYKYMRLETAISVARQAAELRWTPRIEFAMHGEPTMHPQLHELVAAFNLYLPNAPIMVTTNGIPLLDDWRHRVAQLFRYGATVVAIDDYKPHHCREAVLNTVIPGVDVYRYPEGGTVANPHRRPKKGEKRLILIKDIDVSEEGNHSHLSNHAGAAAPPNGSRAHERCALPFRELSVRWDGNVALCCNDWRGTFKVGNVEREGLDAIWHHSAMDAARRKLLHNQRDFGVCKGCTHRTYRNGLLPDQKGLESLPEPTAADDAYIQQACSGLPYTTPVLRKWELPIVEVKK